MDEKSKQQFDESLTKKVHFLKGIAMIVIFFSMVAFIFIIVHHYYVRRRRSGYIPIAQEVDEPGQNVPIQQHEPLEELS